MNILRIFGLWNYKILAKDCCAKGIVTKVRTSFIHIVKKPVRLYSSDRNTMYSHFITFTYHVNNIPYEGTLYVDLAYRCPQKDETLQVYDDPDKPQNYALYSFGPNPNP